MSKVGFYPYPTAGGMLELTVETEREEAVAEDQKLRLNELPEGDVARIDLVVAGDLGKILQKVVPADERGDPPIQVGVVEHSVASRVRRLIPLEAEDGAWKGTTEIGKVAEYRSVKLEPVLFRISPGDDPSFARHKGARLAWGDPVVVEVDESPLPPGGYLNVQWDEFATSDRPVLKDNADVMFVLDIESEPPLLYLNSGIDHLKAVLHAAGRRGRDMRVRDATYDAIVCQVWTSLVSAVIGRIVAEMAVENDSDAAYEALGEWEQRVVHYWAPILFPGAGSKAEAITELVEHAGSEELRSSVQERLGIGIQRHAARTVRAFEGLIRLRDGEGV